MGDLIENQIRSNCKLALPEGLKELMCDISREVLRAQPQNLYDFIANYLSVLLLSREHLSIAYHICDTVCTSFCYKELEDELRFLGLEQGKATAVKEIINAYFCGGETSQTNLMSKLVEEVGINKEQMKAISQALYKAYKRHLTNNTRYYESSTDSDMDEVDLATKHTLKILRKTDISSEEYKRAVDNVKASYRAYGVTRCDHSQTEDELDSDETDSKRQSRNIRFHSKVDTSTCEEHPASCTPKTKLVTVSSSTLAGSYINLPKVTPYSVHDSDLQTLEETLTEESQVGHKSLGKEHKISFQASEIEDHAEMADVESDSDIEEVISLNSQTSQTKDSADDYNYDYADLIEKDARTG